MSNAPLIYRRLQKRIDELPVAYPETQSGVEIRLLERLFDPFEAWIACHMSTLAETPAKIRRRLNSPRARRLARDAREVNPDLNLNIEIGIEDLERLLKKLFKAGGVNAGRIKADRKKSHPRIGYSLMPLAVGMFEMQVNKVTRGYAEDFSDYMNQGLREQLFPGATGKATTGQLRTVPVGKAIPSDRMVGHYDDIRSYVAASPGPFFVNNCVCRQAQDSKGDPCDYGDLRETCLMVGPDTFSSRLKGESREIEREEALGILDRAEEMGFVLQPRNSQDPSYICCCCGDCCEILLNAKKFPKPAEVMHANYYAAVDKDLCIGCRICEKRCPMGAVTVLDKKATINTDRCIGCGLCVTTCKPAALSLLPKSKPHVPPKTATLMFLKMYFERFGPWGTARKVGKLFFKRQL